MFKAEYLIWQEKDQIVKLFHFSGGKNRCPVKLSGRVLLTADIITLGAPRCSALLVYKGGDYGCCKTVPL